MRSGGVLVRGECLRHGVLIYMNDLGAKGHHQYSKINQKPWALMILFSIKRTLTFLAR